MFSFKCISAFCCMALFGFSTLAHSSLKFNLTVSQCEDHYIVCAPLKDGTYQYGFVYNGKSGLIFKLEGSIKILPDGKYSKIAYENTNQTVNLKSSESLVSLLPREKFSELNLELFPYWYEKEVVITESAGQLFAKGFTENLKKDFPKAIIYFNKAHIVNPNHPNLKIQFAKALNGTGNFQKAYDVLSVAHKSNKHFYEYHQELAVALIQLRNIELAEKHGKKCIELCELNAPKYNLSMLFSLYYFDLKNKKAFNYWITMSKSFSNGDVNSENKILALEKQANKW